jgi:hypothetical protein
MPQPYKTIEDELLQKMGSDVATGSIQIVQDSQQFVSLISQNFPFVGSKISWSRVPDHIVSQVEWQDDFSQTENKTEISTYADAILGFFDNAMKATQSADNADIIVLGDSAMNIALHLSAGTLRKYLLDIVDLPQHTYVIPPDASWCLTFTLEGYMDFGFSPSLRMATRTA